MNYYISRRPGLPEHKGNQGLPWFTFLALANDWRGLGSGWSPLLHGKRGLGELSKNLLCFFLRRKNIRPQTATVPSEPQPLSLYFLFFRFIVIIDLYIFIPSRFRCGNPSTHNNPKAVFAAHYMHRFYVVPSSLIWMLQRYFNPFLGDFSTTLEMT